MIYRSKEKKSRKESKTRIKISEFYKWYSSNMVDIKSARYFISGLFYFLVPDFTDTPDSVSKNENRPGAPGTPLITKITQTSTNPKKP